jgi:hypothetical protein
MSITDERLKEMLERAREAARQCKAHKAGWWLEVVEENIEILTEVIHQRAALVAHRTRIEVGDQAVIRHMGRANRAEVLLNDATELVAALAKQCRKHNEESSDPTDCDALLKKADLFLEVMSWPRVDREGK